MSIYMKIPGIKGDVKAKGYEGAIELYGFELGSARHVEQRFGSNVNRSVGTMKFNTLTITKSLDPATNDLLRHMYKATVIPKVEIVQVQTGNPLNCYAKNIYEDVMVTEHHESAGSLGNMETYELCYTTQEKGFTQFDAKNKAQSPSIIKYNLDAAECA